MNWKISILLVIVTLSACKEEKSSEVDSFNENYLIEPAELKDQAGHRNIKVIDFRKKEIFKTEHIVGALNIWRTDIEDASYDYKGIMASPFQIEELFGKLGIETGDTLIIYDDNGLCDSSRLWWLLQNYDYHNVKLLHGGIAAWKAINGGVSSEIPVVTQAAFKLPKEPKMKYYVSKEQVQEALKSNAVILDTRTTDEFSGKRQKKGAAKGGRIPKSIHIDWTEAIDFAGDKRMKPLQDLERIYSRLKITKDDPIIVYCHSGVRSAHTTFVLTQLLGYKNVKNYDGSWTEWSYFNDLPSENDSLTVIKK
jgi:thiosulfate/3-mercaptopyruvate sulfurtransferase